MRLAVNKTYKMLIGGAFVRSESNRSLEHPSGPNYPRATRKDVRDAVRAAFAAGPGWQSRTAYNRGQILYRMAEMLEARADQLGPAKEVAQSVDRLVYYAGWADKFKQVLGSVNPVAAPYFNFSVPEPVGVVGLVCGGPGSGLLAMVSVLAPCVVGGNTCVVLAPDESPIVACEFCEVLGTSDLPAGVVNILTGRQSETVRPLAKHMEVQSLMVCGPCNRAELIDDATENLKRTRFVESPDWLKDASQGLEWIEAFQEVKTVWHPMGV